MSRRSWIQTLAVALGLAPLAWLGVAAAGDRLGANPIETITHATGGWALRFLLVSLAVTPARRWLGWGWAAPLRRSFGLIAFGYATLHASTWLVLDLGFDLEAMLDDLLERRYIAAGAIAYACLVPLALTSTRASIRRLGKRWVTLHQLVFAAAIAALVHFLWLVKADLLEPLCYAAALALLLALRLRWRRPGAGPAARPAGRR
jgi:sulfoxide reductase heme-binding subunit YedZ